MKRVYNVRPVIRFCWVVVEDGEYIVETLWSREEARACARRKRESYPFSKFAVNRAHLVEDSGP